MADQNENLDRSQSASGNKQRDQIGDQNTQNRQSNQGNQASQRGQNSQGEQDDVAEDRNLSGSSTWLNLPDQQPASDEDEDEGRRQSNR